MVQYFHLTAYLSLSHPPHPSLPPSLQSIPGVPPIKPGLNPATWMLEITSPAFMEQHDLQLAEAFESSDAFK